MKKRVAIGMITAMVLSTGVALASPVEMEEGKWNVSAGVMFSPDSSVDDGDGEIDYDSDTSVFGGVTYGITDKWGVQVDYSHYDSSFSIADAKLDATEFNVVYGLNPNLNLFAGYVYAGATVEAMGRTIGSSHTDGFQAGLSGWYPLGDKFKTFGKVGIGNNSRVYEIGFSYAVSDNWDVDLSYRDAEYKDLEDVLDVNYDGVRLGISTSF